MYFVNFYSFLFLIILIFNFHEICLHFCDLVTKYTLRVNFLPILTHILVNIECFRSMQTGLLSYKTKLQDVLEKHI